MDVDTSVDRYIAMWNETDSQARAQGIAEIFADDATYTDPLAKVSGHAGIDTLIAGTQGQFPGYRFKLLTKPDSNHNVTRFTWELAPAGGGESILGSDVAVFTEDGKFRDVYGFLDRVPQS